MLNDGLEMPAMGLGTYKLTDDEKGSQSIVEAWRTGYRLFDCASAYANEKAMGRGLDLTMHQGASREELFVQSKVWIDSRGYDPALRSAEKTLRDLGLDYLDCYLIHWPASPATTPDWRKENDETWRALERLLDEKVVRSIGVSNFMPLHLEALLAGANVVPAVNQVEFNPGCQQKESADLCARHGIRLQAWSPLGRGRVLDHPLLKRIAAAHSKTPAQVCLRWEYQKGVVSLPKSSSPERMEENISIFDFSLTPSEMEAIDALPPYGQSGLDADVIMTR